MSLVEVVIAASVMALVLLAFMSMMYSSSQISATSRDTTVASSIIQSTSETLFSMGYQQFWDTYFGAPTTGVFTMIVAAGAKDKPSAYENKDNKFHFDMPVTGQLRNETVRLYMLPSSDVTSSSLTWSDHAWVDFKLVVSWTDSQNKSREEYIISRRSQ